MLFRETVAVYCDDYTEHTNTLCGQNAEFWCVEAGGTYSNHWGLKELNVKKLRVLLTERIYDSNYFPKQN
jgi:hypothetical protein